MPGTLVPNQSYDHEVNVLKGWFDMHSLDFAAKVAEGEVILAGRVACLNNAAEYRLGLADNCMPHMIRQNTYDFDANGDVGNISDTVVQGLPVIGAYEFQTTEFDKRVTYNPNDHLSAWDVQLAGYATGYYTDPDTSSQVALKGLVRDGRPYQETLVGVVSTGVSTNDFKKKFLTFWGYYLPIDIASS